MKIVLHNDNFYLARFDRGEEVIQGLKDFALREKITAASFSAIGAAGKVTLAYYDLVEKIYLDTVLEEDVEIVGVLGNIAYKDTEAVIHAHGSFSNERCETFGGHVKTIVVSATCEVMLTKLPGSLQRKFDETTGLNLLT